MSSSSNASTNLTLFTDCDFNFLFSAGHMNKRHSWLCIWIHISYGQMKKSAHWVRIWLRRSEICSCFVRYRFVIGWPPLFCKVSFCNRFTQCQKIEPSHNILHESVHKERTMGHKILLQSTYKLLKICAD